MNLEGQPQLNKQDRLQLKLDSVPAKVDKDKCVRSIEDFQKRYFPDDVGKICPHCQQSIVVKVDQHAEPYTNGGRGGI